MTPEPSDDPVSSASSFMNAEVQSAAPHQFSHPSLHQHPHQPHYQPMQAQQFQYMEHGRFTPTPIPEEQNSPPPQQQQQQQQQNPTESETPKPKPLSKAATLTKKLSKTFGFAKTGFFSANNRESPAPPSTPPPPPTARPESRSVTPTLNPTGPNSMVVEMPIPTHQQPVSETATASFIKMETPTRTTANPSSTDPTNAATISTTDDKPKPFICSVCNRAFLRRHDLRRHEQTHQVDAPVYQCQVCENTFTRQDALQRHIKGGRCRGKPMGKKNEKEKEKVDENKVEDGDRSVAPAAERGDAMDES
jgi:hypothetical protein